MCDCDSPVVVMIEYVNGAIGTQVSEPGVLCEGAGWRGDGM